MKRRFPIGIAGVLIAVAIISVIWFYPNITNIFSSRTNQPNHGTETFQLASTYASVAGGVSRNIQLETGQTFVGNYSFSMVSPTGTAPNGMPYIMNFQLSVVIRDPQENVLALCNNPTGTISLVSASSGMYSITFSCTTYETFVLPATLSVTWSYDVNS